jgi:hypothetical protein
MTVTKGPKKKARPFKWDKKSAMGFPGIGARVFSNVRNKTKLVKQFCRFFYDIPKATASELNAGLVQAQGNFKVLCFKTDEKLIE